MNLPRFVHVQQSFPDRAIGDIPQHIHAELAASGVASRLPKNGRVAIGVGSRGISNISTIVKSVVDFWKGQGAQPFIFPAMGSHGAATAQGQADVLAHYGIHENALGVPVISSLEVVSQGKTPEGIETFIDKAALAADGIFLVPRIKWHTDFSGSIESGLCKMMAIGVGKLAGARNYHTYAYKLGLERVIKTVSEKIFTCDKILGGLAIQEGAHHETAGLVAISAGDGFNGLLAREEQLLAQVKSWKANLPADPIDVLIVDEIGKNISGAGMDTKVINRSILCEYNPFPDTPVVNRIYVRGLTELTFGSAVGVGLADVIHDRLLSQVNWEPTYINSLTAATPTAIKTPIHFPSDERALAAISPTVGRTDLSAVTYCWIRNTLDITDVLVSENLVPALAANATVVSKGIGVTFGPAGDLENFEATLRPLATA